MPANERGAVTMSVGSCLRHAIAAAACLLAGAGAATAQKSVEPFYEVKQIQITNEIEHARQALTAKAWR